MENFVEHDRVLQRFCEARLALLQEERDFRREKAALDREYGSRLESLAKKYTDKFASTLQSFAALPPTASAAAAENTLPALPTATLMRSFLDQSKLFQWHRGSLLKWETLGKDWQLAAEDALHRVIEPMRTEQNRTRSETDKNGSHRQALMATLSKAKRELERARVRYQQGYTAHQKLQMTDKKWQPSYNTLIQKKIIYVLCLESYNALQAHLFDLTLPEYEDFIVEQDRLMQVAQKDLYQSDLKIAHLLADKFKASLNDLTDETASLDPVAEITFIMANLNEGAPLNFQLAAFSNEASENDSSSFTRDPVAVAYLLKQYTMLYGKLDTLKQALHKSGESLSGLHALMTSYKVDPSLGSYTMAHQAWLDAKKAESFLQLQEALLTGQLGQLSLLLHDEFQNKLTPHDFKRKGISINALCDHCNTSVWGIKGASLCQACGYLCHVKCAPDVQPFCGLVLSPEETRSRQGKKVPPPRSTSKIKGLNLNFVPVALSPRMSHTSLATKLASLPSPTHSTIESFPKATVLFDFTAGKEDELSIEEGEVVHVTGQMDEDGWLKIRRSDGRQGLVPSNYLDLKDVSESLKSPSSVKEGTPPSERKASAAAETHGESTHAAQHSLPQPITDPVSRRPSSSSSSKSHSASRSLSFSASQSHELDSASQSHEFDPALVQKRVSHALIESAQDTEHVAPPVVEQEHETVGISEPRPSISAVVVPSSPPVVLCATTVLFDYIAQEEDELSISEGESIDVLQVASDGWGLARTASGQTGHVPLNYLAAYAAPEENEDDAQVEMSPHLQHAIPIEHSQESVLSDESHYEKSEFPAETRYETVAFPAEADFEKSLQRKNSSSSD